MDKEDILMINTCLVATLFVCNILFPITDTDCRLAMIIEAITIPFIYLLFYIVSKLVR